MIALNYFRKILHLISLTVFWICVRFKLSQVSEYSKIANVPGFWIPRVTVGLPIFVNMAGFGIWVWMQLWKSSEYSRIANMPVKFTICLNIAKQCLNKLFILWQGSACALAKFHRVLNKQRSKHARNLNVSNYST